MQITDEELQKYDKTLSRVDWTYEYASGREYFDGRDKMVHAEMMRDALIETYPGDAGLIESKFLVARKEGK